MESQLSCCLQWSCLLVIWAFFVDADVYVRNQNESQPITYFLDLVADFGPEIPEKGITGFIHPVKPLNACVPVEPPPDNRSTWIALIARDNCTFADKVRTIQSAGYGMAVIYNFPNNDNLVRMSGVLGFCKQIFEVRNVQTWYSAAIVFNRKDLNRLEKMHGDGRGINIPSVFVGWSDGRLLQTDYCYYCTNLGSAVGNYIVTVDNKEYTYNPYLLWPFAVVVGTCFILMLVFMIFKWCRDLRKKRKSRLSAKHLKKIPTKKFKKGDEYDVCAICLDDYDEGDKIRLLPCSHVYHCACIDPWLTKNKRSCPICKRKVIPGDDPDSESESDNDGDAPSERTPLISGGHASNNNNRRSTFDNSGLPEASRPQRVHNVQETTETDTDSDSEHGAVGGVSGAVGGGCGAVGGVSHAEIACRPQVPSSSALKTETVSETNNKTYKSGKRPVAKLKPVTKEIVAKKETVARDVARGEDNESYEVDSDSSESTSTMDTSSEVYFTDRKEEKKINHVV